MNRKRETRSPIREAPLRQPGQSTLRMMFDHAIPTLMPIMIFATLCGVVSGVFLGHLIDSYYPYAHISVILLPVGAYFYANRRVALMIREGEPYALGLLGEKAVAERLDDLKAHGYRVFHDIPSERDGGANIDHLVIGRGGIFVIETKTRSKPGEGRVDMFYDGVTLVRDDGQDESAAIGQVRAIANELRDWLRRELNWDASDSIRPIVAFPGWWINKSRDMKDRLVWALNDKAAVDWIKDSEPRMSEEIIARIISRVQERVRRHEREAATQR